MTETVTPLSETVSQIVRSRTCGCRDFYIAIESVKNKNKGAKNYG